MDTSEYEVSIVTEISERKEVDGITEGDIRKYDEFRETENGKYYITYNRKYGELKTCEFALVTMDNHGKILTIQLNSIGCFKSNDETILSYDEAQILFVEKMKNSYKRNVEIAVDIQTIMVCKTQDDIPYYVTSILITPDQAGAQDFESIICVFMVQ